MARYQGPTAKCFECGKSVRDINARYVRDDTIKRTDYFKGMIKYPDGRGERILGKDCYAKVVTN